MALLADVYGKDFLKAVTKPKRGKRKGPKAKQNIALSPRSPPMDPDEMDTELLYDVYDDSLRPNQAVRGLKTSVYSDDKNPYQPIQNPNVMTYENQMDIYENQPERLSGTTKLGYPGKSASGERGGIIDILDDPHYEEFLEYLKMKRAKTQTVPQGVVEGFATSRNDQFQELLLYIATGFFMLLLFDNIYKIGRTTY